MLDEAARTLGVTTANWLDAPYNRSGFRHVPDLVRTAPIRRGAGPVRELERAERNVGDIRFEFEGATVTIDEMLPATSTDGFLVLQDGAVVTERYLDGMAPTDTHLLMSVSKSLTSILCGRLAAQGLLTPDDLVTRHVPELAGTVWEGCRLQHLLDMRAGNAWDYDVDEYTAPAPTRMAPAPSATAHSPPTCSDGRSSGSAAHRSPSCSRVRSGRASAPSRTRRSCSTTPASRSSRAASARRCATSPGSGRCASTTAAARRTTWCRQPGSRVCSSPTTG
jgi:hypothetical protein